jgi:glucose/arabinose dehydrogenase
MIHRLTTLLLASAALALVAASGPALAQAQSPAEAQLQGQPNQAEEAGLTDEEVEDSLPPEPEPTGVRPPESVEEVEAMDLYAVLREVRRAPPGLDGEPIMRPNAWASEPETEMAPYQPREAVLFPEDYIE